jgi:GxxExxY protein
MMQYETLTKEIIGAAHAVYNEMGFGFLESVYESCMIVEMTSRGLFAEAQKPIEVFYRGHPLGYFVADLIVDDLVIVELKSMRQLIEAHEVQLVNYLTATGKPVGLLINFAANGVEIKRKVRELPMPSSLTTNPVHPVNPV